MSASIALATVVDLDALLHELRAILRQTIQPPTASVGIRR